jgi:hypothetical protein
MLVIVEKTRNTASSTPHQRISSLEGNFMQDDTKKKVSVQQVPRRVLTWDAFVDIERQGNEHIVATWMERECKSHITVLPERKYRINSTGEIKDMAPRDFSKQNHNLRVTFEKLRGLIRTNFTDGGQQQCLITLTYAHHERDPYIAKADFEDFWLRLTRSMPDHNLDYISVLEPQASGRWHFHLMVKTDQKELWIPKKRLTEIWGKGATHIERLKSSDVGAYYVSYFTHLNQESGNTSAACEAVYADAKAQIEAEIEAENAAHETDDEGNAVADRMKLSKKQIKGARLKYYPAGIKFFTCSRTIQRPTTEKSIQREASAFGKLVHSRTIEITDEEGKVLNTIQKDQYRKQKGAIISHHASHHAIKNTVQGDIDDAPE